MGMLPWPGVQQGLQELFVRSSSPRPPHDGPSELLAGCTDAHLLQATGLRPLGVRGASHSQVVLHLAMLHQKGVVLLTCAGACLRTLEMAGGRHRQARQGCMRGAGAAGK